MKKIKVAVFMLMSAFTANVFAQTTSVENTDQAPIMTFTKTSHDFGTINEGDQVETDFEFTNTGKTALLITRIKASCGCTVPSNWSKEPILPDETSKFTVRFNSKGKPNQQHKSVTITCNTAKGKEVVRFQANVIPDPEMEKLRAERAAKRKEQYELRKLEQQKKAEAAKAEKFTAVEKVVVKKEIKETETQQAAENKEKEIEIIEKDVEESEKDLIKSEKAIKKENKKANKLAKQKSKIAKASKKVSATEKKLQKQEAKLLKTETKGDLSLNDKLKFDAKIRKLKEQLLKEKGKLLKIQSK